MELNNRILEMEQLLENKNREIEELKKKLNESHEETAEINKKYQEQFNDKQGCIEAIIKIASAEHESVYNDKHNGQSIS